MCTPPPHAIKRELRENMKEVALLSEQRDLLCVLDAVSLQCLWLIVEEAIRSQCRNEVHDELTDLWRECTICAVFFSISLIVSMMYLLRNIILS